MQHELQNKNRKCVRVNELPCKQQFSPAEFYLKNQEEILSGRESGRPLSNRITSIGWSLSRQPQSLGGS